MKKFNIEITDEIGLHARPASKIVGKANEFKSDFWLIDSNGNKGNLKSIMNVMGLGMQFGSKGSIEVSGDDEDKAVEAIKKIIIDEELGKLT